jgi:hypothetical protein
MRLGYRQHPRAQTRQQFLNRTSNPLTVLQGAGRVKDHALRGIRRLGSTVCERTFELCGQPLGQIARQLHHAGRPLCIVGI